MFSKKNLLFFLGWLIYLSACKPASPPSGFVSIFDGVSFSNWEGDTSYWKIQDSTIIGEVTPEHPLTTNTFLIYKDLMPEDFELKLEYRISNEGNSGVQYRSERVPDLAFALKGYQADIDGANEYTGQNYEERGRGFLAMRGQSVELKNGDEPIILNAIGPSDSLKSFIKSTEWNELHIQVKDFTMKHTINGVLMSEALDLDSVNRKQSGLLGLQLHVAPKMKIEFRKIQLK